jgi:hypothetical protein
MTDLSVWTFLDIHIVCHTFIFSIFVWLLFLDFSSCVLQKISYTGYFTTPARICRGGSYAFVAVILPAAPKQPRLQMPGLYRRLARFVREADHL